MQQCPLWALTVDLRPKLLHKNLLVPSDFSQVAEEPKQVVNSRSQYMIRPSQTPYFLPIMMYKFTQQYNESSSHDTLQDLLPVWPDPQDLMSQMVHIGSYSSSSP